MASQRAPIFNGNNFDFWKIRMKTIFRSHELSNILENRYAGDCKGSLGYLASKNLLVINKMNDDDSLFVYLAKQFNLINQRRSYGDDLSNQRIVQKLLISLPKTHDGVASVSFNVSKCFAFSSAAIFLCFLTFSVTIHSACFINAFTRRK
ncbi:unnamed protein product [Malus baccata var. baccata]